MRIPERLQRPMLLLAATLIGGGIVGVAPLLQRRMLDRIATADMPAIVSVGAAQRRVPFSIRVPEYVPEGGRLLGVRVGQVVLDNPKQVAEQVRENTRPSFGYGIGLSYDLPKKRILVHVLPGSPAERAGISTELGIQLLAVNGYRVESARHEEARLQAYLRLRTADARRRFVETGDPLLEVRMDAEPLHLTLKEPDGKIRVVMVPRKEKWIFRPQGWTGDPAGNRAALLFTVRGRQLALHESRSVPGGTVAPKQGRRIVVLGTEVWLSGPLEAPGAFWRHGGVDFVVNNYQHAVSRQEVMRIINSLLSQTA